MQRAIVVIPTYNEAENLPLIVPQVLDQDPRIEVLVVDDNSPDGTGRLAAEMAAENSRIHVQHREAKAGLGAAYRDGLAIALDLGAEVVIQMDADFSHPPDKIPTMLEEIESHDVVLGSRYLNGITVVNWPIERNPDQLLRKLVCEGSHRAGDQRYHGRFPMHAGRHPAQERFRA